MKPREPLLIDPFGRREIEDAANDLEPVVGRTDRRPGSPLALDPWLQGTPMDFMQRVDPSASLPFLSYSSSAAFKGFQS